MKAEFTDAEWRHLVSIIQLDSLSGNKESVKLHDKLKWVDDAKADIYRRKYET